MMALHRHYVATGYVYDRNTDAFLLIFHRKLGKWLAPGGHLHEGEEPHVGVQRELLEETGLEGRIIDLLVVPDVHSATAAQLPNPFCILSETIPARAEEEAEHIHIDFIYVIEINASATLKLCVEEIALASWIPAGNIDNIETFENVKQVCRAISACQKT
jgi:8-oxo-dGTP diphosphatase